MTYRDVYNRIHVLTWSLDDPSPIDHDVTGTLGGDIIPTGTPFGYAVPELGRNEVLFGTSDHHVHEAYGASWSSATSRDLNEAAALSSCGPAPNLVGNPVGYAFEAIDAQNAIYRGEDGHIHEMYCWTGELCHSDLTANANSVDADGDPAAYVAPTYGVQNVFYRGDDDAHELYWSTGEVGTPSTKLVISRFGNESTHLGYVVRKITTAPAGNTYNGRFIPPTRRYDKIDPTLAAVISKPLSPDPAARFASCTEMAAALRGDLKLEPTPAEVVPVAAKIRAAVALRVPRDQTSRRPRSRP